MARPAEYPEWASGGSAVVVDPLLVKKQLGWIDAEKPAGPYMNWWQNLVYKWVLFFDSTLGLGYLGDGADGTVTLDGVATVPWATLVGSTYTMSRDAQLINLTINNGIKVKLNGAAGCFALYGQGLLDNSLGGDIDGDGASATTNVGAVATAGGTMHAGNSGGAGNVDGIGGNVGSPGTNATTAHGGAGGHGGDDANGHAGGLGGTVTAPIKSLGQRGTRRAGLGYVAGNDGSNNAESLMIQPGGGGGGGACSGGLNAGGGGGASGAYVGIAFAQIKLGAQPVTKIHAFGGAGAPAGNASTAAGGGGGGGGGALDVFCLTSDVTFTTACVAGGAPGGGLGGGSPGIVGAVGQVRQVLLSSLPGLAPPPAHPGEAGVIVLTGVEAAAVATFVLPFGNVPGSVGGYRFKWSIARTDGVGGDPSIVLSSCTTLGMAWTINDPFAGYISWEAIPT